MQGLRKRLEIPRSVPGLVTKRLLVMNFIDGDQITRLAHRTRGLSQRCLPAPSKILPCIPHTPGTPNAVQAVFSRLDLAWGHVLCKILLAWRQQPLIWPSSLHFRHKGHKITNWNCIFLGDMCCARKCHLLAWRQQPRAEGVRWRCGGRKKKAAAKRIMERVAEAFGTMMLETGLFQADAHPGNILVLKGAATVALRVPETGHQALYCLLYCW